jgi:glutamate-1-semialdehyde 2,1-aminomutase
MGEEERRVPRGEVDLCGETSGKDARDVLGETAACDVREAAGNLRLDKLADRRKIAAVRAHERGADLIAEFVDVLLGAVLRRVQQQLECERITGGVEAVGGKAEEVVAFTDGIAGEQARAADDACKEACELVVGLAVEPGRFSRFAAQQSASVGFAGVDEAADDLLDDVGIEEAGGEVVEEEERRCTLHGDVVDAVVDEVGADAGVEAELDGEFELAAYAVGGGDEDGVGVALGVECEEPGEAADLAEHLLVEGSACKTLDAVLRKHVPVRGDDGVIVVAYRTRFFVCRGDRAFTRSLCSVICDRFRQNKSRLQCRMNAMKTSLAAAVEANSILVAMALSFTQSAKLQQRAEEFLPGGVDSPVRAFRAVGGHPPFVERGEGAYLIDADGNRFVDLFGSWGPMLLGHAFAPAVAAIRDAAGRSPSFGASTADEANLAELVRQCYPSIQKLRFVSSGTEACMSAIRLARGFTGRPFVIKFEGCYHGHADALLVKAGSGVATFGIPGSAGVPAETAMHTLALPYNDLGAVEAAFASHPGQIACVILEPVVGNAGTIAPESGYLAGLRAATERHGALLIYDEVMTGFRLAAGGAQELFAHDLGGLPDLTTLGKIVGGGLPVGVFGGRAEIMDYLSPLGPVYQAGTLSGNPLAMAAGIATLRALLEQKETLYAGLDATTSAIADGVAMLAAEQGIAMTTNRVGSMFTWFFTPEKVTDFSSAATSDTAAFGRFHRAMLERGIWLPPSQFEAAFVSAAHGEAEVALILEAAREALRGTMR